MKDVLVKDLVFLDETGVNLAMVNFYARAIKGQRTYSKQLLKRGKKGKNVSIIGAMTLEKGFLTSLSFDGETNGYIFLWFIEEAIASVEARTREILHETI